MNNDGEIIFYDEIEDELSSSREFLTRVFKEFSVKCIKFFEITDDLPYIYSEKQLHSILVPVIDNIADAILVEHPTSREIKESTTSSHGWIDYWVKSENIIYLIELKHSYSGLSDIVSFRKKLIDEWATANQQLEEIPKKNIGDFKINDNDNVIKIALQFNTTYANSNDSDFSIEKCEKIGNNIVENLDKDSVKPNFIAHWNIPNNMKTEYNYINGSEKYPYLHMFAKVY